LRTATGLPEWIKPQLTHLVDKAPDGRQAYLDGELCGVRANGT
jgi:hypothetical protein